MPRGGGGQARTGPEDKLLEDLETGVLGGGMYTGTGADVEEVAEWLGAGRPGGELRNGRRSRQSNGRCPEAEAERQ